MASALQTEEHMAESWTEADARAFVMALFEHVAREDAPRPEWIEDWTRRAVKLGDAAKTFAAFVSTPGHVKRLAEERDARPRWPIGHFYSPVPSRSELTRDAARLFGPRDLPGVDLRDGEQLRLLNRLAGFFDSIPFPEKAEKPFRYHYANTSYNFGDALIYWAMLNHLRPTRILEIGSGFSSALALDTLDVLGLPTRCTFVDPYPQLAERLLGPLAPPHSILPKRVQDVDLVIFEELQDGDLLFIDSTHVLKTGSDVHFELTQVLPRLAKGVVVHFHDMFAGFEYPRRRAIDLNYAWNEVYALHIFLQYNKAFEVLFFNHHIATTHRDAVIALGSAQAERYLLNPGGGLWLRRC
jgi:hypothetical protein